MQAQRTCIKNTVGIKLSRTERKSCQACTFLEEFKELRVRAVRTVACQDWHMLTYVIHSSHTFMGTFNLLSAHGAFVMYAALLQYGIILPPMSANFDLAIFMSQPKCIASACDNNGDHLQTMISCVWSGGGGSSVTMLVTNSRHPSPISSWCSGNSASRSDALPRLRKERVQQK